MANHVRNALSILLRPMLFALYGLSGCARRDPLRWVFGSWDGQRFTDNAAALFLYCTEHEQSVEATWISARHAIVRDLRRRGLRAHHAWSPGGLRACLRAGVFVFDGYTKDINHWLSRGAKRVHLRHGVGIKKVERAIDTPSHRLYRLFHGNILERCLWRALIPWHDTPLHLVAASSEEHARQGESFYGVPRERIAITGFPRNDVLFAEDWERHCDQELLRWIRQEQAQGHAVFFYMPTFRDNRAAPFPYSWQDFDRGLEGIGARVLARFHFADVSRRAVDAAALRNVRFQTPASAPYPLFRAVDALITDFSSVAYDFLLTRKPVLFFNADLESYRANSRGLWFDYDEVTPGPRPRSLEGLLEAMRAVRRGDGVPEPAYQRVLDRFHRYKDGKSAERACRAILDQLLRNEPANAA